MDYDALRGLAVLCMVIDHLCLVFSGPPEIRHTIGRLALPIFFVLAGHLARRLTWRHLVVGVAGFLLPLAADWIDYPNVLLLWSVGCVVIVLGRWAAVPPLVWVILGLTILANGWATYTTGYPFAALLGFMGLGAALAPSAFTWAAQLPGQRLLVPLGAAAVYVYVGHVLVLSVVASWMS